MPDSVLIEAVRGMASSIRLISSTHTVTLGEVAFSDTVKSGTSIPITATASENL